jgi:hypothetical protein
MTNNLKIFFSEDSYLIELETEQKEWRGDILIAIDGKLHMLEFITIDRLTQEYRQSQKDGRLYIIDDVTVIVEKPDRKTIIDVIISLSKKNFFKSCKTIDLQTKFKNTFSELTNIKNWVQVY